MSVNAPGSIQMKRIPIKKCRICDVLSVRPLEEANGNFFESPLLQKLARVHLFGTVTDVYISSDNKYGFFVLDDTTGVIRCKCFGDTTLAYRVKRGQMADVIGRIREYNAERYILPEIIRSHTDPNVETLRWLEIIKALKDAESRRPMQQKGDKTKESADARAKILEIIKAENGEAEYSAILSLSGLPDKTVDAVLSELLSEGSCYEPRPGRIKLL